MKPERHEAFEPSSKEICKKRRLLITRDEPYINATVMLVIQNKCITMSYF